LLLHRLFEAHPEYQKLFANFQGLTLQELRHSKKLSAHATNVMYSVTGVVDNLEDPECLTEMLIKLGQNHRRHEVTEKEFHVSIQSMGTEAGS
jgi:hemoglobin-like flavoprotein